MFPASFEYARAHVSNVGGPAAFANAVVNASSPLGVRDIDVPLTRENIQTGLRSSENAADENRIPRDCRC